MDWRYVAYTAADRDFYDVPWSGLGDEVSTLTLAELPAPWQVRIAGPWAVLTDGGALPETGWKVHVACLPGDAARVVTTAAEACLRHQTPMKALRTEGLVLVSQGKYADRSASGKVVTSYPRTESALVAVLDDLSTSLHGLSAPRPAGDVPVPGTPLSLRFGAFTELWTTTDDGTAVPGMRHRGQVVTDTRTGATQADRAEMLIAEDIDLVAEAFEVLLGTQPDFTVVGRVGRGDEVLEAVSSLSPDVALLDVEMPGMDGIEAAGLVRAQHSQCRVLLLTALPGSGHVQRALAAGASGYLVKSTSAAHLADAIRTVADGGTVIDPDLAADALRSGPDPLTDREVQIVRHVAEGLTTDEIAATLFLSRGTVRNYLSNAMAKLGVTHRTAAVAAARERGWV